LCQSSLPKAIIANKVITKLVGGFNRSVLPWNNQSQIGVFMMKLVEYLGNYELEQVVIDIAAYDEDNDKNGTEGYVDEFYTNNITKDELMGIVKPAMTKSAAGRMPLAFFLATSSSATTVTMIL